MRLRPLGSTGIEVSEIGLGTWGMSGDSYGPVDDSESVRLVERAIELGVTLIDTADAYGRGRVLGLIGEAIRGKRDSIVLSVRIGNDFYRSVVKKNFAPSYLAWAVEQSLRRLGTDRLDLLLLHNPANETLRRGDCFRAARDLRSSGKIRAWGASVTSGDDARLAVDGGAEVIQLPYNLLHGQPMNAVISDLPEPRPGLIAYSALEYGILAGAASPSARFGEKDHRRRRYTREELRSRAAKVGRLRFLVHDDVQTMAQAALRFCLANHALSSVLAGTRSALHLEQDVEASVPPPALPEADLRRIGEVLA
ncbi:MAG: aldo/keto reductase [Deltaproteobacteria bacterium]|nr:aldo/keto reductase [Deltaproteobacteria bacterium]